MFKNNPGLIFTLIKVQSALRGLISRKKVRGAGMKFNKFIPNDSYMRFSTIPNNKITDDAIRALFEKYPPLNDNINVKLKQTTEYENKAIYYGERRVDNNQRHGRGIQIWIDGSKYEGEWAHDKANGHGTLYHADGDIYTGNWKNGNIIFSACISHQHSDKP